MPSPNIYSKYLLTITTLLFLLIGAASAQTVSTVYTFSGIDGEYPYLGRLTQGRNGALYGVTLLGGANNLGTVFEITAAGIETVIYNFDGTHGSRPEGGLLLATDGYLYGTTLI